MRIKTSKLGLSSNVGVTAFLGLCLITCLCLYLAQPTIASSTSAWFNGTPYMTEDVTYRHGGHYRTDDVLKNCTFKNIKIAGIDEMQQKCVVDDSGVSIDDGFEYIRLVGDSQYYPLNGATSWAGLPYIYSSSNDTLVVRERVNGFLSIDRDISKSLTQGIGPSGQKEYTYTHKSDFILQDSNGDISIGAGGDLSRNGRWMVVELYGKGLARIDLHNNYKTEIFSDIDFGLNRANLAISDDGKYAGISGRWFLPLMFEITDDCTRLVSPDAPLLDDSNYQGCEFVSLFSEDTASMWLGNSTAIEFGQSNYDLRVHVGYSFENVCNDVGRICLEWRTIRAGGYSPPTGEGAPPATPQLQYLALGDSYSSGEGDIGNGEPSPYMSGTEGPKECHLSINSYPFILSDSWGINASDMRSVACSGARVVYDYYFQTGDYKGQDNRMIDYSESQKEAERNYAINFFKPGVLPQLEFIKKYKPRVITLTAGGNDVGFGDILKMCATPEINVAGILTAGTCPYAGNADLKSLLTNSIRNQYGITKKLLRDIQQSSPNSKVYLIGYPKFITDGTAVCMFNSGDLNSKERAMINDMQEELNDVLWRAATDSGVTFIDIEDSLEGGKLCQGSEYMTGLVDIGPDRVLAEDVLESFHPNAKGHMQMARTIYEKIPSVSHYASSENRLSSKSGDAYESSPISKIINMTSKMVDRISKQRITIAPASLQPGSSIQVTIYSDPVDLGSFTVGQDGSVDIEVTLPEEVSMGYHTLVIEGVSNTGEPSTFYQYVTVTSGVDGDVDGDGIPNDKDRCMFIAEWYDEQTGEDVCSDPVVDGVVDITPKDKSDSPQDSPALGQQLGFVTSTGYVPQADITPTDHYPDNIPQVLPHNTMAQVPDHSKDSSIDKTDVSGVSAQLIIATVAILMGGATHIVWRKYHVRNTK